MLDQLTTVVYCNEEKKLKMPKTFEQFKTLFLQSFSLNQIKSIDFNFFELYYEDKEKQNMRVIYYRIILLF